MRVHLSTKQGYPPVNQQYFSYTMCRNTIDSSLLPACLLNTFPAVSHHQRLIHPNRTRRNLSRTGRTFPIPRRAHTIPAPFPEGALGEACQPVEAGIGSIPESIPPAQSFRPLHRHGGCRRIAPRSPAFRGCRSRGRRCPLWWWRGPPGFLRLRGSPDEA